MTRTGAVYLPLIASSIIVALDRRAAASMQRVRVLKSPRPLLPGGTHRMVRRKSAMGMTAIEKVLAQKCGLDTVKPGDVVYPEPDFVMVHDNVLMSIKQELDAAGIARPAEPDKVILVTDHEVLYGSARAAQKGAHNRR